MAALPRVAAGRLFAFPGIGLRGVEVPVVVEDRGGRRLPGLGWRRDGRRGSGGRIPETSRPRIWISSRLIWRSNYMLQVSDISHRT